MRILIKQKISNLNVKGFEDVERYVNILKVDVDGEYERIFVKYALSYEKNGEDVTKLFPKQVDFDWYITNDTKVLLRDENFEKILKDEYVNMEVPEGEVKPEPTEDDYQTGPGFTVCMDMYDSIGALPYDSLRQYIIENDVDGRFNITLG